MKTYTRAWAEKADHKDALGSFFQEFYRDNETIYLVGNSLGLLSKRAEKAVLEVMGDWRRYGVEGWTTGDHPWFYLSERIGDLLTSLVGAEEGEVVATGSTTVNLHQLLSTFYRPSKKRWKLLADELTFPSDIYAMQSQLQLHGFDPEVDLIRVGSKDGHTLEEEAIVAAMTEEVAVAVLPSVLYRSGQILDMKNLITKAHERGILIGFDLCHSIGIYPHTLSQWGADFAFWCNYKYVNGGPGGVAGLYVPSRHHRRLPGLAGWFSSAKERQFDMEHRLTPAEHAGAFQIGTPHILSLAPLLGSLEIFFEAGIDRIRKKSLALTQLLMDLIEQELPGMGFTFANPLSPAQRGGHVCLVHKEAVRIAKALKARGVVPDYRAPNMIRLAPAPLYTSYVDIWETVQRLKTIMEEKSYENYENERGVVA